MQSSVNDKEHGMATKRASSWKAIGPCVQVISASVSRMTSCRLARAGELTAATRAARPTAVAPSNGTRHTAARRLSGAWRTTNASRHDQSTAATAQLSNASTRSIPFRRSKAPSASSSTSATR